MPPPKPRLRSRRRPWVPAVLTEGSGAVVIGLMLLRRFGIEQRKRGIVGESRVTLRQAPGFTLGLFAGGTFRPVSATDPPTRATSWPSHAHDAGRASKGRGRGAQASSQLMAAATSPLIQTLALAHRLASCETGGADHRVDPCQPIELLAQPEQMLDRAQFGLDARPVPQQLTFGSIEPKTAMRA